MLGFTVAAGLMGAIVGSVVVAKPTDVFGRRGVLRLIGPALRALAKNDSTVSSKLAA